MSMEEVTMYQNDLLELQAAIENYARLAPLDLLKPSEIQADLLAIAHGDDPPSHLLREVENKRV